MKRKVITELTTVRDGVGDFKSLVMDLANKLWGIEQDFFEKDDPLAEEIEEVAGELMDYSDSSDETWGKIDDLIEKMKKPAVKKE